MKPSRHFMEIGKKSKGTPPFQNHSDFARESSSGRGEQKSSFLWLPDLVAKDYSFNITAYISSGADVIADALWKNVEEEARDLSGEAFLRFMDQLYEHMYALLQSNDVSANLLAIHAIDALIDMPFGEGVSKVSKFACFLRNVFEVKHGPEILVPASTVLGHLAKAGGAMTADEVEQHVTYN
ncbi:hypothetical protein ACQ4PT_071422 [Festuca glaucescens]